MSLKPYIGKEPILVRDIAQYQRDDTQLSTLIEVPYNSVRYISPGINERWEIDSVTVLVQTDADVGSRRILIGYYGREDTGVATYNLMAVAAASETRQCVAMYRTPYSSYQTFFTTCPLPISELQYPNRLALFWDTFKGAGDRVRANVIYHESVQL